MSMHVTLGGPDRGSVKFLKKWPRGFYISPLVNNFDCELQRFLAEQYFKNGSALSGKPMPAEVQKVRDWACGYLDTVPDNDVSLLAQYFVQRVRNYTDIRSLSKAGIPFAKSTGECHESVTIGVEGTRLLVRSFRQMSLQEYGEKVYGQDLGFPPFSLECRCLLEGYFLGAP
jgi:hypothetical protein